ncbi:hypothetical protein Clacol_006054 [Clathrus columnatus]|uniref:Uncharacterized protein n=1 Tax=Clathrus columnatus TaxID=1419009 RepID=A0AAV5AFS1_9AGAM|nr:hypothetical protein Clacol_006054 [Clathrus columnatus]
MLRITHHMPSNFEQLSIPTTSPIPYARLPIAEMDSSLASENDIHDEDEESRTGSTKLRFPAHGVLTSASERFWSQIISPTLERRMNKNLNNLEFAWAMKRGTLNLDTRSNVFCLGAKFKTLWEDDKWLLVPEDHILDCYYSLAKKGEKLPDIGEGPYKYQFFVHLEMKSIPLHRQIVFPDVDNESLKAEHFAFFSFPFKDVGTLTSHVHPKYVICHIGARTIPSTNMLMIDYTNSLTDLDALKSIIKCIDIVSIWSPDEEDVASKHPAFFKSQIGPNDVLSKTSDQTGNRRLQPYMCDRRLIEEWGYVYVKEEDSIKLKYKEDAPHLLTAKKLRLFEERMFVHQTPKTIQSWRSTVSGDPEEQGQIDNCNSFENAEG